MCPHPNKYATWVDQVVRIVFYVSTTVVPTNTFTPPVIRTSVSPASSRCGRDTRLRTLAASMHRGLRREHANLNATPLKSALNAPVLLVCWLDRIGRAKGATHGPRAIQSSMQIGGALPMANEFDAALIWHRHGDFAVMSPQGPQLTTTASMTLLKYTQLSALTKFNVAHGEGPLGRCMLGEVHNVMFRHVNTMC